MHAPMMLKADYGKYLVFVADDLCHIRLYIEMNNSCFHFRDSYQQQKLFNTENFPIYGTFLIFPQRSCSCGNPAGDQQWPVQPGGCGATIARYQHHVA